MSTAQDLVTRAFRRLAAIDINSQPSASEMTHALNVMGEMVNGWGAYGLRTDTQTIFADITAADIRATNIGNQDTPNPDATGLMLNLNVVGTGVPAGAFIAEVVTDNQINLSAAALTSQSQVQLTCSFLPLPIRFEGAMIALLALRLAGDLGIAVPDAVGFEAEAGWRALLAGYIPDRRIVYDRSIARPAGIWNANTDWLQ